MKLNIKYASQVKLPLQKTIYTLSIVLDIFLEVLVKLLISLNSWFKFIKSFYHFFFLFLTILNFFLFLRSFYFQRPLCFWFRFSTLSLTYCFLIFIKIINLNRFLLTGTCFVSNFLIVNEGVFLEKPPFFSYLCRF